MGPQGGCKGSVWGRKRGAQCGCAVWGRSAGVHGCGMGYRVRMQRGALKGESYQEGAHWYNN